ncbi:hypothetical protein BKA70DRAFT_1431459 [Coprinopsis sp. MPI-PUGE-AT-0042]|nr:hypothetical protein BKA70DRAFT_1431459 [Coprinopsis sp. MPI-PUGE-AT-0042]
MNIALEPPTLSRPPIYIGPTPLPLNKWNRDSKNADEAALFEAYETCLSMESGATGVLDLMYARILGYVLLHVPLDTGRTCIAHEILDCQADLSKFQSLAQRYQSLLRAFRRHGSAGSEPSYRYGYSLHDLEEIFLTGKVQMPIASHSAAKQAALRRDTFKCLVTGRHDSDYLEYCIRSGRPIPNGPAIQTVAAHILPPHINGISRPNTTFKSESWSTIMYSQLKHFGVDFEELNGAGIYDLGNIMTMGIDVHHHFDNLRLWFEVDPCHADGRHFITHAQMAALLPVNENRHVIFPDTNPSKNLELPKSNFLKAHGAVCRTAHLSGFMEFMDSCEEGVGSDKLDARAAVASEVSLAQSEISSSATPAFHHVAPVGG